MKINIQIFYKNIRIPLCSFLICISFFIFYETRMHLIYNQLIHNHYHYSISISILISAIFIKTNSLIKTIILGILVGILVGIFYFLYYFILSVANNFEFPDLLIVVTFLFTIMWIASGISGGIIGFFIRKKRGVI